MSSWTGPLVLIPCGAGKRSTAQAACTLYDSSTFRMNLAAARSLVRVYGYGDEAIRIVSAQHGLVELDAVIEPYETTIDSADAVTPAVVRAQAIAAGLDTMPGTPVMMLPKKYAELIKAADVWADVIDGYSYTGGIGDQRGVARRTVELEERRTQILASNTTGREQAA